MQIRLPTKLYNNEISQHLDKVRSDYIRMSGRGNIDGIMCLDQDAKIIAVNGFFDKNINPWDLAALGAAQFGVARQAKDSFDAQELEHTLIIFKDKQFFIRSIGEFEIDNRGVRHLLLGVLADKKVNIGLILLQMQKYAKIISNKVKSNNKLKAQLKMSETEMREFIKTLKENLFKKTELVIG
ncbi:MAG: roadblock/LC7 domain-containing protein [Promethearchaeota archaeon]